MKVLSLRYKMGTDTLLDILSHDEMSDQQEIAENIGCSVATIERKIAKLKKEGLLTTFRTKNNDVYYCIGDDVKLIIDSYEAVHTYAFRQGEPIGCVEGGEVYEELSNQNFSKETIILKPEDLVNQDELRDAVDKLGY